MSIAVIKKENGIYTIGADKAWVSGDRIDTIHETYSKIRKFSCTDNKTNFYVAGVGYQRDISLLFDIVLPNTTIPDFSVKSLYDLFKEYNNKAKEYFYESYSIEETEYIIAFNNKAYHYNSYGIMQINDYCAIGSGSLYALGALYNGATVKQAIYTACHFSSNCSVTDTEPIIYEIKNNEK